MKTIRIRHEEFLKEHLSNHPYDVKTIDLLAHLYHHRMMADAARVRNLAHQSIRLAPDVKKASGF